MPRRSWAVVEQLRRAALSADVNLVEGYALGTAPLFRRHARIALGSAAEAQRLLAIAAVREYLPPATTTALLGLADRTVACLVGLLRSSSLPFSHHQPAPVHSQRWYQVKHKRAYRLEQHSFLVAQLVRELL